MSCMILSWSIRKRLSGRGEKLLVKLTAIENAIIQLGDGDFKKFCDTFLSQKQYGKIHGQGMKSGTPFERRMRVLEERDEIVYGKFFWTNGYI